MVAWKFEGKDELCLVGKNFSFEIRLEIFVMMKSVLVRTQSKGKCTSVLRSR